MTLLISSDYYSSRTEQYLAWSNMMLSVVAKWSNALASRPSTIKVVPCK